MVHILAICIHKIVEEIPKLVKIKSPWIADEIFERSCKFESLKREDVIRSPMGSIDENIEFFNF